MDADAALYRQVLAGDTAAFGELVARYHTPLFRYLYRLTDNRAAAEDLLQETFTRLITFQGRQPDRFRPWIYAVAGNLARDYFRSASFRYESASLVEEDAVDDENLDDLVLDAVEQATIAQALQRLSPEHREVIVLRFYHGMKLEEIAEVAGVPVGTIKSRMFHALRALKVMLSVLERRSPR